MVGRSIFINICVVGSLLYAIVCIMLYLGAKVLAEHQWFTLPFVEHSYNAQPTRHPMPPAQSTQRNPKQTLVTLSLFLNQADTLIYGTQRAPEPNN